MAKIENSLRIRFNSGRIYNLPEHMTKEVLISLGKIANEMEQEAIILFNRLTFNEVSTSAVKDSSEFIKELKKYYKTVDRKPTLDETL
jgi:hypothetical protein